MKKILFAFILGTFYLVSGNAQTLQEGIQQMENENYAAALNTFNALCKADSRNSIAYYYIGEVNYLLENNQEAEKAYRKGLSINSQCSECYIGLGKLELDKGNTAEAEKHFETAIRANKKNASVYGFIGDAYLYGKKPNAQKAIEYLNQAKAIDPKKAVYWAHLGEAYEMTGNHGEAMSNYEIAVEKDPSNVEAYINMARIWARAQQEQLAIPKLEEAIRLAPNDARPIKDLYELYIRERQYEKVIPLLEKYTSLIGDDVDAQVRLVKFLTFQAKDYDRAIEKGEKLLKTYPDQYTLHRWLAWSYVGKARQMEENQKTDPSITDSLIINQYAKAYEHSNKLFDALEIDSQRQKFPEDYEFWALSTLKTGKVDEAAHIYRKYIEFEPSKAADIYGTLAKTYFDSANYVQAIVYYNRKAEIQPLTNVDDWYQGLSYYYSKQYAEADSSFARLLEITPDYANGWFWRARSIHHTDTVEVKTLAKPFYEKFIELAIGEPEKNKKNLVEAYHYLAFYHVQHDDLDVAKSYYEKILQLDPTDKDAAEYIKLIAQQNR